MRNRFAADIRQDFGDLFGIVSYFLNTAGERKEKETNLVISQFGRAQKKIFRIVRPGVCQGSKGHGGNVLNRDQRHCAVLHR